MRSLLKDLSVGVRALRRQPGSAAISVLVLALGIGLCSFMFSVVYGVYYRGLDVPDPHRVFMLMTTQPEEGEFNRPVPVQDFHDWRERQTSFTGLLGVTGRTVNVSDAESPRRLRAAAITANAFEVLGIRPAVGRVFVEGDDRPGAAPNIILSHATWRDHYGMDPDVVGSAVRVNGEPAEVIGVMPEDFAFPFNNEAWVPLREDPLASPRGEGTRLSVFGRLRDGVTREQAGLELSAIASRLAAEHPESNAGIGARLEAPERAATGGPLNVVFTALMIAVTCVLLVACANVANLLLARAATRSREAGVRLALGAGRLRVMTPYFAEAAVLATAGALLGIVFAHLAIAWFDGVTDPARTGRPYFIRFQVDLPILAYVGGLTVLTALAAGLAPAWQMSRTNVGTVLKDEARGAGARVGRLSRVLVTAEVALSCALLVGAGLMTKSILKLGGIDYPYETDRVFTAQVSLFEDDYPDPAARQRAWDDVLREVRALPGVAAAGLTSRFPLAGTSRQPVALDGVSYEDPDALPTPNRVVVTPGYFEALGVRVLSGRDFTDQDDQGSERVAIVSQPMVDRYFEGRSPLGRQIREGAADSLPWLTVVGVVPDLGAGGPSSNAVEDFEPAGYYVPLKQADATFLGIAALPRSGEALALTADVRLAVRRAEPDLPIFNVWTQAEVVDRATWFYGVFGTVFIVFGAAALFMASVGLYGVLAFAVSRRTQEMGIRMALGAGARDVVTLVARQGGTQLAIGLGIGLAMAFGLTRLISLLMYDVDPQDTTVFGAVVAIIVIVGMAAAYFPARRATAVDPVEALRYE